MSKWIGVGVATVLLVGVVGVIVYETTKKNNGNKCLADAECPGNQQCVNGKCVGGGCNLTGCPDGQHCNSKSGDCVPDGIAECSTSVDCPTGYGCFLGECSVREGDSCGDDGQCPPEWGCYNGKCKDKCYADTDCDTGFQCLHGKCQQ